MAKIAIRNRLSFRWGGSAPPLGHVYKPWAPDYVPLFVAFVPKGKTYEETLAKPEFLTVDFAGLQRPTIQAIKDAFEAAADIAFSKRPVGMGHYILEVNESAGGFIDVDLFFDVNSDQMDIILGGHEYISKQINSPDWEITLAKAREILNRWSEVKPIIIGRDVDGAFMHRLPLSADFEPGYEYASAFSVVGPNQVPVYLFGQKRPYYYMPWDGQSEFFRLRSKRTVEAVKAVSGPLPFDAAATTPGVGNFKVVLSAWKLSHGNAFQWKATVKIADSVGTTIIKQPDGTFLGGREGVSLRTIEKQIGQLFYYAVELTGDYEVLKHFSREEARIEQADGYTISSSKIITVYWPFIQDGVEYWVYPGFLADSPWQNEMVSNRIGLFSDKAYFANCPQLGIPDSVALSATPSGPWQWITNDSAGSGVRGPSYVDYKKIDATPKPKKPTQISSEALFWKPTLARSLFDNTTASPPAVEGPPPVVVNPTDPVVVAPGASVQDAMVAISAVGAKVDNLVMAINGIVAMSDVISQNVRGLYGVIGTNSESSAVMSSALNKSLYSLNANTALQADTILSVVSGIDGKILPRSQRLLENAAVALAANLVK